MLIFVCLCSVHVYVSYVICGENIILGSLQICDALEIAPCLVLFNIRGRISPSARHKCDTVFSCIASLCLISFDLLAHITSHLTCLLSSLQKYITKQQNKYK